MSFINFVILQWFHVRVYKIVHLQSNKTSGFGFMTKVKPLSGWWDDYNEDFIRHEPFIFRKMK